MSKAHLSDAEWSDILATLPENPETADGWELSLVQRTVERVLTARLAEAWNEGVEKARQYRDDLDLSILNPYSDDSKER